MLPDAFDAGAPEETVAEAPDADWDGEGVEPAPMIEEATERSEDLADEDDKSVSVRATAGDER